MFSSVYCLLLLLSWRSVLPFAFEETCQNIACKASEAERFREDGFAFPFKIFTEAETDKLQKVIGDIEQQQPQGRFETQTLNLHLVYPELWSLVRHPKIVEAAALVSGFSAETLRIMSTTILTKYPADPNKSVTGVVGWHQDLAYWNLHPAKAFTCWIAVDNVTIQNGAMQMMPKLHDRKLTHQKEGADADNVLMNKQAIPQHELGAKAPTFIELSPGHMSIHGGWTPHTSSPNNTPNRRLGLIINWIPDDVKVGPSLYNTTENPEWRLPVHPADTVFPPRLLKQQMD